jgi:hypothetical protein
MKKETITWTETFTIFEPGDRVKPSSPRCSLADGVYEVERCHVPMYAGDEVIVHLKGQPHGISGEYLVLV